MSLNEGSIERAEVKCFAITQSDHGGSGTPDPPEKAIVSWRFAKVKLYSRRTLVVIDSLHAPMRAPQRRECGAQTIEPER